MLEGVRRLLSDLQSHNANSKGLIGVRGHSCYVPLWSCVASEGQPAVAADQIAKMRGQASNRFLQASLEIPIVAYLTSAPGIKSDLPRAMRTKLFVTQTSNNITSLSRCHERSH